jgi:glycosyltransferase involved in cell wall biosynthesis
VVTAGHLSTCPRMLKAADALVEEGYDVDVVATRSTRWATETDATVLAGRAGRWKLHLIDYTKWGAPLTYLRSGLRQRWTRRLGGRAERAYARVHDELVLAALETGADFFYGGTTGGIAATAEAARRASKPYALDLEDFYSGVSPPDSLDAALAEAIEEEVLPGASFLTASSQAISAAYQNKYGVEPSTIHNVFSLPRTPPELERSEGPLKLYWFSQTIGPGRGLEQALEALERSGIDHELHLRGGRSRDGFELENRPSVLTHAPAPPDEMTELCRGYDIGLALEQSTSINNALALSNKLLTYPLAGLALVMTETEGHRPLIEALGEHAIVVQPGDVEGLARGFERLATDRGFLAGARRAAWEAARNRWHWEHPAERGRLISLVEAALTPLA